MKFLKRIKFVFKFWKFLPFLKEYFLSPEVSAGKKLFPIAAGLLYILLPLDLVPDFLSIFGFTDDIVITSFVLQQMVKMAPESLKEKYKVLEEWCFWSLFHTGFFILLFFQERSDFILKTSFFLPILCKAKYYNMEVYLEKTITLPADVQLTFGSLLCWTKHKPT